MVLRVLSSLSALGCVAAAQSTLVLPPSHAVREGSGSTNVPFGRSTPVRVQQAYDALLFQGPVTITSLALRVDGGTTAAGKQVDCEIRMSTMPGSILGLSATFAQNRGADETVVLPQQLLSLPAHTVAATPSAFGLPIALAVPFAYDPSHGALLVEIAVNAQPPGAYALDVAWVCDSPAVPLGPAACPMPDSTTLRVESATTQLLWGRPWTARVLDAPPTSLVLLALGTIESGPWNGFVLPQDLAVLGAPGCWLSIDVAASAFALAAADGSAAFTFAIPNTPVVVGWWLRYQGASFVPASNALGVVTSQAQKVQICGFEPVGRVWAASAGAASGTREIGLAPVLQLGVQ